MDAERQDENQPSAPDAARLPVAVDDGHGKCFRLRGRFGAAFLVAAALLAAAGGSTAADDRGRRAIAAEIHGEPLVGVGLVIGLAGTGDSAIDAKIVDSSIIGTLKRVGIEPWQGEIEPGRVAMVVLSAEMPRDARDGAMIEVRVRAIGNAGSLAGGTLLVAPLRDGAGAVHAVGQGSIAAQELAPAGDAIVRAALDRRLPEGRLAQGAAIRHQDAGRNVASLQ